MADPLVEQDDVETVLLRSLTEQEENFIVGLCDQVSAKLRAARPRIDAQIDEGTLTLATVSAMLGGVVARFMNNPTEANSTSEGVGIFNRASAWSPNRPTGLVILPSDLAQLDPQSSFTMPSTFHTAPRWGSGLRTLDCEI